VLVLDVLAQPTRRQILDLLRERPRLVGELSAALDLSQPLTSKHLRVLRDAGLVDVATEGKARRYHLRPAPLAELDEWLAPYRWLWEHHVDRLEAHLDHLAEQEGTP
jgi:DNA-binding transcriptional ArsR family regulator